MTLLPEWLTALLDAEVNQAVGRDARTSATTYLGWPRSDIFWDVIGGGQADFDAPMGRLSGEDRVLLYAKYNQVRHLEELNHAFGQLFGQRERVTRPALVDLGCGPFTAGLSLAAVLGPEQPFRYFGVDRSQAMLRLGRRFADVAFKAGALNKATSVSFSAALDEINFGPVRGELTVVVASYLLASPTLQVDELVVAVLDAVARIGSGPAAVLYTNSANANARARFPTFRDALVRGGFSVVVDDVERFDATSREPKAIHYALLFRPAQTTISLGKAAQ